MTKPTDTDSPKEIDQDIVETVVADSAPTDTDAETQPAPKKKSHGGRNVILILLFIVAAVAGALALSGKFMPLYESITASLHPHALQQDQLAASTPVETKVAPSLVVSKPVAVTQPEPEQSKQEQLKQEQLNQEQLNQEQRLESASAEQSGSEQRVADQIEPQQPPAISSEDVQSLLSSIEGLRRQLQQMSVAQRALQNGLKAQQQMNLQVRLRWIVDPASRLPQLQLAWEEISLLPGLSNSQRSEAVRMHKLARARVQQLKQWQDALNKWADALVTPVQRNILPQPEYPWLAWIVSQFQLRQAPSVESRHLSNLRARLLDAARHLTLESWPLKGEWQSLQAELLLQIKAMQHGANTNTQAIEIGLPESFDAIQADIATLRHTALQWQHGGVQ